METAEDALKGALDIIAENLSDDATIRRRLRNLFTVCGVVRSKSAKEEDSVYAPYYDFSAPVEKSQAIKCWQSTGENGRDF